MAYRIRSEREKQRLVAAWRKSGLPKTRFATENGLPPSMFSRWVTQHGESTPSGTRFVPVHVVEPAAPSGPLVVQLARTGHRIEVPGGFDATEVRRLADALC